MNYIDIHCHLHDPRLTPYLDFIVQRARKAGVCQMISCATSEENFDQTMSLAKKYSCILPCIGIHPWFLRNISLNWEKQLAETVENSLCGIGETGLDFMDKSLDQEQQIQVFSFHLNLANELKRPIQIHVRKAWDALIHILKKTGPLQAPGILHSYSGSADLVRQLLPYNLYFSFSGALTRKNARKIFHSIQTVPKDRILIETDAPDILPSMISDFDVSQLGVFFYEENLLNEPSYLPIIAKAASECAQMSCDDFAEQVYQNSLVALEQLLI